MNVLIIEDDDLKLSRLEDFLGRARPGADIELAKSYKSGLKALVTGVRSLVILDMTLPSFDIQPGTDGGRPLILGGAELLRQMKRRSLNYPSVVVTGFDTFGLGNGAVTLEQLDNRFAGEFADFYIGMVYFNATTDDWKDQLRSLIDQVLQGGLNDENPCS